MAVPDQSLAMDEDQALIREAALQFLEGQAPRAALRGWRDGDEPLGCDAGFWKAVCELGWPGLLAPEANGGAGMGFQELGVVFEALGRHVAPTPLLSSGVLAVTALDLVDGWEGLPEAEALVAGECPIALALEETRRFDPFALGTVARRDGDRLRLSGRKRPVLDGTAAEALLVVARLEGEEGAFGLFRVDPRAPGVTSTPLRWIDGRRAAEIVFDDVALDGAAKIGVTRSAEELVDPLVDRAAAALAAELVGVMTEAFAETVAYLMTRVQFDRPLAEFQALQHRCARLFADVERTISVVQEALRALDAGEEDASMLASAAKAMASETARTVTEEALQLYGGLGMTEEQDIGLYFKRARTSAGLFGDAAWHYRRFARLNGF